MCFQATQYNLTVALQDNIFFGNAAEILPLRAISLVKLCPTPHSFLLLPSRAVPGTRFNAHQPDEGRMPETVLDHVIVILIKMQSERKLVSSALFEPLQAVCFSQ